MELKLWKLGLWAWWLGFSVVLGRDIDLLENAVVSVEGVEVIVTASPHLLMLNLGPRVHCDGMDGTDMDPKAAVLLSAVHASPIP